MKKIAVLLCSFFVLLTSFSTAHAQENVAVYDSLHIPAEEIENFAKTNEDDSIICKYYVNFLPYICGEQTGTVRERLQNELQTFSHCLQLLHKLFFNNGSPRKASLIGAFFISGIN